MHYYQPRVHLVRAEHIARVPHSSVLTFAFPQTRFVAVTAYQNNKVRCTELHVCLVSRAFAVWQHCSVDHRRVFDGLYIFQYDTTQVL